MNHTPDRMSQDPPSDVHSERPGLPGGVAPPLKLADQRSSRRNLALLLSVGVILGGIIFLMADSSGFEYYKHVDEVQGHEAQWQNKRLQLHGFVVPGTIRKRIDREHQKLEYKFQIENCGAVKEAHFAGVVPDTFKEGAEVVLKGTLATDEFSADEIMAKCPSKYAQNGEAQSAMLTRCAKDSKKAN